MGPPSTLDLSIALDMETLGITGELILDSRLGLWLDAAQRIAPRTFEILLCSGTELPVATSLPAGIKAVVVPGGGYYALKSRAVEVALGGVIFVGDIDCRPDPDYFVNLLRHFDDPALRALGGRSYYDGNDLMTRANSVSSWGYIHNIDRLPDGAVYLGHNIAFRRGALAEPFGPYIGRYGGDEYFTRRLREMGDPLYVFQDLKVYHESVAYNLRGLLDRQMRETVRNCFIRSGPSLTAAEVLREAPRTMRSRWIAFKKHRKKFGFSRWEEFRVHLFYRFYAMLGITCALAMYLSPALLQRWLRYQFGDLAHCTPVSQVLMPAVAS